MNDRQLSKVLWVGKAALIAALLYVAVDAVVTPAHLGPALKPRAVSGDERQRNEIDTDASPAPRLDYSVILENNVFGASGLTAKSDAVPASAPGVAELPSAEDLGLLLRGIVAGGPAKSRAIIEDTAAKLTIPYKIGDRVASATVESIEPDRVILLHHGRRAVLHLRSSTSHRAPGSAVGQETFETMAPATLAVDRQESQPSVRLGYVEDVFRKATITPYVRNGRTEGLEITGLEETPLTKLFGLRNGDVVQTVNGQDLSNKQKAFEILKKARTQSKINVQLLRNGKAKDLSFDL